MKICLTNSNKIVNISKVSANFAPVKTLAIFFTAIKFFKVFQCPFYVLCSHVPQSTIKTHNSVNNAKEI